MIKDLETKEIPVDKINLSQYVSRLTNITKNLEVFAENIKKVGLIQPIVVYPKGERYELIIGQRRLLAVRDVLKLEKILARIIEEPKSDEIKKIISYMESSSHIPLTRKDKIDLIGYLFSKYNSVKDAAECVGLPMPEVRAMIGLPRVPDVVRLAVGAGEIKLKSAMMATNALAFEKGVTDESEGDKILEMAKKMELLKPRRIPY